MIHAFIRRADGTVSRDSTASAISAALADADVKLWVDMTVPSEDELRMLSEVFHFHPLAIEDSIKFAQRPKIENYTSPDPVCPYGYFYMVFHGPDLQTFRQKLRTKEIDLFMSDRFLVTIHDERMKSVDDVLAKAEADASRLLDQGMDVLLYQILDRLTDNYQPILDYLEDALDELEEEALTNPRRQVLSRIAAKKRELLNLRRIIGPQREVVAQLTRGEVPLIRESTRIYFRDVQDHLIRVVEMVELYRDLVLGARDIYLSSISNRTNQIMKTLTIISVIGLPLTVITGFFGMNFDAIPGLHDPRGFWGAVAVMGVAVAGMLWMFRKKRWI
ncbi:MAG: magnesium/cobalt transporter CorA [Tepidisphaeraceae bacterium]